MNAVLAAVLMMLILATFWVKWGMLAGIAAMAVMSQNLVPVQSRSFRC